MTNLVTEGVATDARMKWHAASRSMVKVCEKGHARSACARSTHTYETDRLGGGDLLAPGRFPAGAGTPDDVVGLDHVDDVLGLLVALDLLYTLH